ncbi:MAG: glycosyltransferase [Phycisphaerales bacterium]
MATPLKPIDATYTGPRPSVSVVILTLNEEINLEACLDSCRWSDDVTILDSGSTDRTAQIAASRGVKLYTNPFLSFGEQRNWAIDSIPARHDWVFHLDADERFTPELVAEMQRVIAGSPPQAGFYVANQMIFMERWIKHASGYPAYQMRLFHKGRMRFKDVGHGQRENTSGEIGTLAHPYVHLNFSKGLSDWFARHNRYSTQEAERQVTELANPLNLKDIFAPGVARRRALERISVRVPMRTTLRFLDSYLLHGGILDGRAGFRYACLMATYQQMIDLKIKESKDHRLTDAAAPRPPAPAEPLAPLPEPPGGRLRILHVTHTLDPAWGGPPAVVIRIAAAQASLGHDVTIISTKAPKAKEAIERSLKPIPGIERVKFTTIQLPVSVSGLMKNGQPNGRLEQAIAAADFVQVHQVWLPICLRSAAIARRMGIPYCVTPHSELDPWALKQRWLKKFLARNTLWKPMLRHAAFLQALTPVEADGMRAAGITTDVHVVPNGVFLEELQPLPEPGVFRRRVAGLGDKPFIVFLSRLHYKKGLDYLAEAFKIVAKTNHEAHLVVVGPDDGVRADFESRINQAGLAERVHVFGPVYGKERLGCYVDADVFCLPSRMEGFSVAITESLACGTPVVVTHNCNFPEVATVNAGFVVDLNAEQVADGLTKLLADSQLRRDSGQRGKELVTTQFTWPVFAEKMVAYYRKHVKKR